MQSVVVRATAVERIVQHALADSSPGPTVTTTASTLCWSTQPLDGEGTLPRATVTWAGHGGATRPTTTDPAGEAAGRVDAAAPAGLPDLSGLPVGAGLVAVLSGVEVADTNDGDLVDVAARWQDVISWATAMQSRALGEVSRRRGWTTEHNTAAAEISARLHIPQTDANKLMARGTGLAEHPQVMNALHHATIDTTKADILLRSGNPLTTEERDEAITRYLPQAPNRTRRWLRDKMNQHATHLHGTTEVAQHATTRRNVFLDPADNSMAWITANLPATDAAALWDAIEQTAHTLRRTPGTTRTLAQARADALVALTTGRIIVPPHPECAPTTATGTGTGTSNDTAPGKGIEATPGTGTGTSTSTSTGTSTSTSTSTSEQTTPRTTVPATGCTCGGCTCGGTAIRVLTVQPQIRVTVPATMLLGLDNTPGHLDGHGPIPAETAARIATDATWQRLLTDPATGILTDYSTTTYQPGKTLRQAAVARDQTCCFPQCDRPARHADLDHIQPYDHQLDLAGQPPGAPGQTRAHNLQPLCRGHHLAKTHHGWDVSRDPDTGTTTWTAPTGHTHTRPPTQVGHVSNDITSLAEDTRQLLGRRMPAVGRHLNKTGSSAGPASRAFQDEPPF